jgi:hypothetical protein
MLKISATLNGQDLGYCAGVGLAGTTIETNEIVVKVRINGETYSVTLNGPNGKTTSLANISIGQDISIGFSGKDVTVLAEELEELPADDPPTTCVAGGWNDPS